MYQAPGLRLGFVGYVLFVCALIVFVFKRLWRVLKCMR
jgi:hypothetical protein